MNIRGSYVALVTPFKDGKVNEGMLAEMVAFHHKNGTAGLVPCGTTGETPTLSDHEKEIVIKTVIEANAGKLPVFAGTTSNNTAKAIADTLNAKKWGATGALVAAPYYNKPTQAGLEAHFKAILEQTDFPLMVYNIPGRTAVNIGVDLMEKLMTDPRVVAVKEATGILDTASETIIRSGGTSVMSGDDSLTLPILSVGGKGVVSVVANLVPKAVAELVSSWESGNHQEALEWHQKLFPLCKAMFAETNPCPVKWAMTRVGMDVGAPRLPLVEVSQQTTKLVTLELQKFGLIQ